MPLPRISLSVTQNFLKESVINTVFDANIKIPENITVIDIGAGTGNITAWLAKHAKNQILAYELDQNLTRELFTRFTGTNRVAILNKNFLQTDPPEHDFMVVANIPFMYTTSIIKQLTEDPHFIEGYIVVQKEAAFRFGGHQVKHPAGLQSILMSVDFTFEILHTFTSRDFTPAPNVSSVLLHIKRKVPLLRYNQREDFEDFVSYLFTHSVPDIRKAPGVGRFLARSIDLGRITLMHKKPSELTLDDYYYLFSLCDRELLDKIMGSMETTVEQGESVVKVYRTRNASDWRDMV